MLKKLSAAVPQGARRENGHPLPKTVPLRGSLHAEWKRCGKSSCRCLHGALHGPYFYRHERRAGQQRKIYVRAAQLGQVRAGIDQWRRLHPPARTMRRELALLRRLVREVLG